MALLDQIVISGAMFCLNLALITHATPEAYGRFILVFSLHLLAYGAQNALVLTPVSVLLPGQCGKRQRVTLRMLSTLDLGVVSLASLTVVLLVAAFQLSWEFCAAAFLLVVGTSARELHRTIFQTRQLNLEMVRLDVVTMIISAVALFLLWKVAEPELAALYALAIGNLVAVALCARPPHRAPLRFVEMVDRYRSYWKKSRWALLGAGLTEAQLRLYVFVVELARGSAMLGILHTGRVLINPVSLLAFSWARASRPLIAKQLASNDNKGALRTLMAGILYIGALGGVYLMCLHYFWPYIEPRISGGHGVEIGALLILWSIFSLINLPSVCISVYLQAAHRYRDLTLIAVLSVLTSSALLGSLFFGVDISSAIWALIIGEVMMLTMLLVVVWCDFLKLGRQTHGIDVKPSS